MVVEALVRLAHEQRPCVVVMSGDVTQRAKPRQFRAAREFVERMPGLPRHLWVVQAGTAVSHRVREGISNSVNLIRWADETRPRGGCVVERWDYLSAIDAFSKVHDTVLQTGPR